MNTTLASFLFIFGHEIDSTSLLMRWNCCCHYRLALQAELLLLEVPKALDVGRIQTFTCLLDGCHAKCKLYLRAKWNSVLLILVLSYDIFVVLFSYLGHI